MYTYFLMFFDCQGKAFCVWLTCFPSTYTSV